MIRRLTLRSLGLLLLLAPVSACNSRFNTADLTGSYAPVRIPDVGTLTLHGDFTYECAVRSDSGEWISFAGSWSLYHIRGGSRIVLNRFLWNWAGDSRLLEEHNYDLPVRSRWGQTTIVLNDDIGQCFVKE